MMVFYHDFDSNVLYFLQAQSPHCQLSQTAWKQCSVYLRESPRALWVFSDETSDVSLHSLIHTRTHCDFIKYSVRLALLRSLPEVCPKLYAYLQPLTIIIIIIITIAGGLMA